MENPFPSRVFLTGRANAAGAPSRGAGGYRTGHGPTAIRPAVSRGIRDARRDQSGVGEFQLVFAAAGIVLEKFHVCLREYLASQIWRNGTRRNPSIGSDILRGRGYWGIITLVIPRRKDTKERAL